MTHDGSSAVAGVREGDVLAGKYRVERVLGVGGMGVVVAAHHVQLDSKVALKFLLPAMLGHREAVDRFAREARAVVKITNEHVARVFDVGTLDNGAPYMVMEFLEGGDLADWIRQHGPLPVEQAIDFVLQACIAVAEAHGLGIVHRDLKPANLFCVRRSDGQLLIKVLDFGISKMNTLGTSNPGGSVTQTSSIMGSPLYMSPEQMQSPKTDDAQPAIRAMGDVHYELLTGRTPFDGETIAEVAVKAATQLPPPIRAQRPDVHPDLEVAIFKCLGERPERTARERRRASRLAPLLRTVPCAGLGRSHLRDHSFVGSLGERDAGPAFVAAQHLGGPRHDLARGSHGRGPDGRDPGARATRRRSSPPSRASSGSSRWPSVVVLRSKHDHAAPARAAGRRLFVARRRDGARAHGDGARPDAARHGRAVALGGARRAAIVERAAESGVEFRFEFRTDRASGAPASRRHGARETASSGTRPCACPANAEPCLGRSSPNFASSNQ